MALSEHIYDNRYDTGFDSILTRIRSDEQPDNNGGIEIKTIEFLTERLGRAKFTRLFQFGNVAGRCEGLCLDGRAAA